MAKTLEWTKDGDRVWIARANGYTYLIVATTISATGEVIYGLGIYGVAFDLNPDDPANTDFTQHDTLHAAIMRAEEDAASVAEDLFWTRDCIDPADVLGEQS